MFHHLAVALAGAILTVLVAWRLLGYGAVLLMPFGASLASLILGIALSLRGHASADGFWADPSVSRRRPER